MDLATSADIVSNVLSGFGMQALETGEVVDMLSKAFTTANTNLHELGEAMSYAAPVASAYGMSIQEATAAVGFLSDAGIKGGRAGTSLRQVLLQISDSADDLGISVRDADGNLKGLADILEEVENSGHSTAHILEELGARAGPGLAVLLDRGADGLREYTEELENSGGTAERVAEQQMEGLNGALKELRSAFEELQIAIADSGLLDMVTRMVQAFTGFTRRLSETSPAMLRIVTIFGVLLAAIGPLLIAVGSLIRAMGTLSRTAGMLATRGLPRLNMALAATRAGFTQLNRVMAANPILALATALTAGYAAFRRFTRGTSDAAEAQSGLGSEIANVNALLEENKRIQEGINDIDSRMDVLAGMDERQADRLKEDIEAMISAQQDMTLAFESELRDRLRADKQFRDAFRKQRIQEQKLEEAEQKGHDTRMIEMALTTARSQVQNRMRHFRQQLAEEKNFNTEREGQLREHLEAVEKHLEVVSVPKVFDELGEQLKGLSDRVKSMSRGELRELENDLGDRLSNALRDAANGVDGAQQAVDRYSEALRTTRGELQKFEIDQSLLSNEVEQTVGVYDRLRQAMQDARSAETGALTVQEILNARDRKRAIEENINALDALVDHIKQAGGDVNVDIVYDDKGLVDFGRMEVPVDFVFPDGKEGDRSEVYERAKVANKEYVQQVRQSSMTEVEVVREQMQESLALFEEGDSRRYEVRRHYLNQIKQLEEKQQSEIEQQQQQVLERLQGLREQIMRG